MQAARIVSQAIRYIENHLDEKLELDMVASALCYSKFHLHRIFTKTIGLTIHEYAQRRQLTEAAKLLVFSKKPIIEIALISGYESQQAFTSIFKAMYKIAPAEFRQTKQFYPLQLEIHLKEEPVTFDLTKDDIQFTALIDVDDWMELVTLTIDGYPRLDETEYLENLRRYITNKKALILRDDGMAIGVMGFSIEADSANSCSIDCLRGVHNPETNSSPKTTYTAACGGVVDFLAVHPQYRNLGVTKIFLDKLAAELLCGKEITVTTYRAGDKADTGYREELIKLGFVEGELITEYGYPVQKFVLSIS
jgi:AraC-like DNA-binding protein/GNAT superfamily N-acetyltransferase